MSGQEFFVEMKRLFFCVIAFTESEKNGTQIPLNTTAERYQACLGTSRTSITNFEKENTGVWETETRTNRKNNSKKINIGEFFAVGQWCPSLCQRFRLPTILLQQHHGYHLQLPILKIVTVNVSGPLRTLDPFISVLEPLPTKKNRHCR